MTDASTAANSSKSAGPSKSAGVAKWALQILLALAFTAAAAAKLAGAPMMVQTFDQIGFGQWFRIVTALVELLGAVALLTPFAAFGGFWLAATMVFATLAHIIFLHTNPAPAIVLIVLDLLVVWLCRDQLAVLRRYF
jgi:hypothetical protein